MYWQSKTMGGSKTLYRHIIKYTGFFGVVQVLNLLAAIARNKIVAVLLGPVGLGLISIYNTVVKFLNDATNLGVGVSAVRYVAESDAAGDRAEVERIVQTVRVWTLLTAVVGMALCVVLSPLLSWINFTDASHWYRFLWLSPVVGLTMLSAGELSILKGVRKLRQVAVQSLANALLCIVVTFPFFYLFGVGGILPALLVSGAASAATVVYFSFRAFPYRFRLPLRQCLQGGVGMIRLGVAFVVAGVLGSGVEMAIRAFISWSGSMADVGLYNAGYVITVTYASVVFMAMETDYFPRLSAVNGKRVAVNSVVNRQIEVSLLLVSPCLIGLLVLLPVLLPLVFSAEFSAAIEMVRFGVLAMFLRAVMLPIEYISLAKGRSWVYLMSEAAYDVIVVDAVILGYSFFGLRGAGMGLFAGAVFGLVVDLTICYGYYRYVISRKALLMLAAEAPLMAAAFVATECLSGAGYWIWGSVCLAASAVLSFVLLERNSGLLSHLFHKKSNRHENIDSDGGL